jgi:hypothetical protein
MKRIVERYAVTPWQRSWILDIAGGLARDGAPAISPSGGGHKIANWRLSALYALFSLIFDRLRTRHDAKSRSAVRVVHIGHFHAAKDGQLPNRYLRIVGALQAFIHQGAVANVAPYAIPGAHRSVSLEERLAAPGQAEDVHKAVRTEDDFPVMPHQAPDDEPGQLFGFLAVNRDCKRAHHKPRRLPRPDARATSGKLAMYFLILRKPPRTVFLQVGGGIGVTAAEEHHRGQVMFKVRLVLVALPAGRDLRNLRTVSYRHELAREDVVAGFRSPRRRAINAGFPLKSLAHPNLKIPYLPEYVGTNLKTTEALA